MITGAFFKKVSIVVAKSHVVVFCGRIIHTIQPRNILNLYLKSFLMIRLFWTAFTKLTSNVYMYSKRAECFLIRVDPSF